MSVAEERIAADEAEDGRASTGEPERPIRASLPARLMLAAAIETYILLFTRWTFRNHDGFGTFGFDLGIYDQGMWLLSQFEAPFVTIIGRNLFGDHTSFILLPFVPLYWLWPGPKLLLLLQTLALGLAAFPVFLFARDRLRNEWLATGLAVAFLCQPAVGWLNMENFHPDSFEVPALLFAIYFGFRRRWLWYFVFLALFLSVKEDTPLVALALGAYLAWRVDRRMGLITCGVAAAYLATAMWVILPALNDVGSLNAWRIPFGGPSGFLKTAVVHPTQVLSYLWSDDRPFYVWQLVSPVALLALLAPSFALIAAIPLGLNVVSNFWYQYHLQYHYTAAIPPLLVIATILGIARLDHRWLRPGAVAVVLAASVTTGWLWGPASFARNPAGLADPDYPGIPSVLEAISLIPDDAVVSTFYGYITHLEHRKQAYEFPVPWHARNWGTFDQEGQRLPEADEVEYVIVPPQIPDEASTRVLTEISSEFVEVYRTDHVVLLRRRQ